MKVLVPEIAAHANIEQNKNQEILSVDFHPTLPVFASAGAGENQIIVWKVMPPRQGGGADEQNRIDWVEFLFEMTEARTVNICRFSPCGTYLACGDAGGQIFLLACKPPHHHQGGGWLSIRDGSKEVRKQNFRGGHTLDVQDLAWSKHLLASAAMDNLIVLWDWEQGVELHRFRDHSHYCQGVAWQSFDAEAGQVVFLATASVDETCLVVGVTPNVTLKKQQPITPPSIGPIQVLGGKQRAGKLFANEVQGGGTFCRRLCFSPHGGELLLVPGGIVDAQPAVHIFRFLQSQHGVFGGGLEANTPCATLQGFSSPALAVRFHPREFVPSKESEEGMATDARFVFAVATLDSVLVYDTEQPKPLVLCEKMHYAGMTDLTWQVMRDGSSILVASNRDGCFSVIQFDPNELGEMRPAPPSGNGSSSSSTDLAEEWSNASSASSVNKRHRRVALENLQSITTLPQAAAAAAASPIVNVIQPRRIPLVKLPETSE